MKHSRLESYGFTSGSRQSASFEYDPAWLQHIEKFALESALQLTEGPFHTMPDQILFGAIGDSAPDRWGRVLIRRAESARDQSMGEAARTISDVATVYWTVKFEYKRLTERRKSYVTQNNTIRARV